jgi:sterol desaturase/sphingolipid hydroxylase (fatty acid hydroxylase superfamily)
LNWTFTAAFGGAMPIVNHASLIRLGCFAGVLLAMAVWEACAPRRRQALARTGRWPGNLGLAAVNTLAIRLLVPSGVLGVAAVAEANQWGLLNQLDVPGWLRVVLALLALDLTLYLQHVLFHTVPALWRLHLVHHADLDFDTTTGVRFHTVEILLSLGIKSAAVAALGAPVVAVLIFEIVLNAASLFNHGNVALPRRVDRLLRLVLVTPDMHRVHHSAVPHETNSNFGFSVSWWDYLFGTYRSQPAADHERMTLGVRQVRDARVAERLPWLLALPLLPDPANTQPADSTTGASAKG